jgi:glycosyltransferase involved in cell wall biosynthesis
MHGTDTLNDLSGKMQLLYITNKPVFPLVDGGCKAMAQFLNCLLEIGLDIDHICVSTHKHPFSEEAYPEAIRKKMLVEHLRLATEVRPKEVIKHIFNRKSYNISRFDSALLHDRIKQKLKERQYSHVILDSLYACPYLDTIRNNSEARIIVRTHNVEHLIWRQLATNQNGSIRKWYMKRLAEDLKRFEIDALNKADQIFTITKDDAENFRKHGVQKPLHTVPVAVSIPSRAADTVQNTICFIGSMNWGPNIEAVNILRTSIFPKLKKNFPDLQFHLAGSFMDDQFPSDPAEYFVNHGFVEDSNAFLGKHGILVLPLLSGSGVKIKVLEAMALGTPVVTTSVGAMGIDSKNAMLIADKEDLMIDMISQLINSKEKRKELGDAARHMIVTNYSTKTISEKIQKLLNDH